MGNPTFVKDNLKLGISAVTLIIVVAIIHTIAYFIGYQTLEIDSLQIIDDLVLSWPPEKYKNEESGEYFYLFSFSNSDRQFTLEDKYYSYSRSGLSPKTLKAGDTISVRLTPAAVRCYNDFYKDHYVDIVSYSQRNVGLIDLPDRNRLINARNKVKMQRWWIAGVLGIIAIPLILLLTSRKRRSNNQAATF